MAKRVYDVIVQSFTANALSLPVAICCWKMRSMADFSHGKAGNGLASTAEAVAVR